MGYNPKSDAYQDRRDAQELRRQAKEAWGRHKNPESYKDLMRAAQDLEAEAKALDQE